MYLDIIWQLESKLLEKYSIIILSKLFLLKVIIFNCKLDDAEPNLFDSWKPLSISQSTRLIKLIIHICITTYQVKEGKNSSSVKVDL